MGTVLENRKKEEQLIKHSNAKLQKMIVCQQVLAVALEYVEQISLEVNADKIQIVTKVKVDGT